ncbi:MAG: hypothetical protein HYZ71_16020 [Deltaproteobacteria bacterium]|nr:hypothetical protein [Deltaproteobacteria bacterium]
MNPNFPEIMFFVLGGIALFFFAFGQAMRIYDKKKHEKKEIKLPPIH